MAEYSELIDPATADDVESTTLDLAAANDLPVSSWSAFSFARPFIRMVSEVAGDLWFAVAAMARGGVLGFSSGAWLTLLARSQFDEERVGSVFTIGTFVLADGGGGPHTITVGSVIETDGGLNFAVSALPDGATLALNGTLNVTVTAAVASSDYNIPNGSTLSLVTSYPTVTATNPAISGTDTWITTQGADVESDATLTARLPLKWATLATGSPPPAYEYWALSTAGVTRATVDDLNPDGPGTVRVYIDSSAAVATLQATIDAKVPTGTSCTAVAATTTAVTVPGVVTVDAAVGSTACAAEIAANLVDLAGEIPIGGVVRQSEVIQRIMDATGAIDFEIGGAWAGTPNIQLGAGEIPQFTLSLSYVT